MSAPQRRACVIISRTTGFTLKISSSEDSGVAKSLWKKMDVQRTCLMVVAVTSVPAGTHATREGGRRQRASSVSRRKSPSSP